MTLEELKRFFFGFNGSAVLLGEVVGWNTTGHVINFTLKSGANVSMDCKTPDEAKALEAKLIELLRQ